MNFERVNRKSANRRVIHPGESKQSRAVWCIIRPKEDELLSSVDTLAVSDMVALQRDFSEQWNTLFHGIEGPFPGSYWMLCYICQLSVALRLCDSTRSHQLTRALAFCKKSAVLLQFSCMYEQTIKFVKKKWKTKCHQHTCRTSECIFQAVIITHSQV